MNDIEYSLLELIENPKRINNIPHCRLFDYVLQAKESQDRFESFILTLYNFHYYAAFGFSLMCSDIVPLKDIFKDKFQKEDSNKKTGGGTELAIFQQLIIYFERKYILSQKNLSNFCSHAYESLGYDEYLFVKNVFSQKYKDELYESFKKMYENGNLPKSLSEWFSFSMDKIPYKINKFTTKFYPVKNSVKYFKIRNVLIDANGKFLDENESVKLLNYIKRVSCPNVCELYVQDNKPYMVVSTDKSLFVDTIKESSDDFIKLIYDKYTNFLFIDGTSIVSIASLENKFFTKKKITCKSIDTVMINAISINKEIPILLCKTEKDELFVVYIPYDLKDFDFKTKSSLEVIEYQNNLYLRG